ncbi:hypothetical protein [Cupriavidus necator]
MSDTLPQTTRAFLRVRFAIAGKRRSDYQQLLAGCSNPTPSEYPEEPYQCSSSMRVGTVLPMVQATELPKRFVR